MEKTYSIGQLAKECGCKVQTLRYYEEIELIPKPGRNSGNQRVYRENHRKRLNFIRHSRQLGFSLEQIRQILALSDDPGQSCDKVNMIAKAHLDDVTYKIARLQDMQQELARMVRECSADSVADCRIIEVLSNHSLCHSEHGSV
jgi:Cu(I)-responsive transcriptional regulator